MPGSPLFQTLLEHAPLPDEAQQWLQAAIEPAHFKKGEKLLRSGSPCRHLFFISEGLTRHYFYTYQGEEKTTWFSEAGGLVTDFAAFTTGGASVFNIEALHWAGTQYDSTLIDVNWRQGHMRCFLPRVHDLPKAQFEALGPDLSVPQIPVWVDSTLLPGPAESRLASISATSVLDSSPGNQAANALDGDISTFWSSGFGEDTAALTLDFDSLRTLSSAKLIWDFVFFARAYTLLYSADGQNWQIWATAEGENGQVDLFPDLPAVQARYVRLLCTEANLSWYSLAELEVYLGDCDCGEETASSVYRPSAGHLISVELYPNPAQQQVRFKLPPSAAATLKRVVIWNAAGQRVLDRACSGREPVEISQLPPGYYKVVLTGRGWQGRAPLIVAR